MNAITETTQIAQKEIHSEHVDLLEELAELERGLEKLECQPEVFANLEGAEQLEQHGRHLADWLPEHFRHEEETLFAKATKISPELEDFCRAMKDEHSELLNRLSQLCGSFKDLQDGESLYDTIFRIKLEGKKFTIRLRDHVTLEEEEFSGFL